MSEKYKVIDSTVSRSDIYKVSVDIHLCPQKLAAIKLNFAEFVDEIPTK